MCKRNILILRLPSRQIAQKFQNQRANSCQHYIMHIQLYKKSFNKFLRQVLFLTTCMIYSFNTYGVSISIPICQLYVLPKCKHPSHTKALIPQIKIHCLRDCSNSLGNYS